MVLRSEKKHFFLFFMWAKSSKSTIKQKYFERIFLHHAALYLFIYFYCSHRHRVVNSLPSGACIHISSHIYLSSQSKEKCGSL